MISQQALQEFEEIWRADVGTDISKDNAMNEAVSLLTLFSAAYKPVRVEWNQNYEYENANKHLQKTNLSE